MDEMLNCVCTEELERLDLEYDDDNSFLPVYIEENELIIEKIDEIQNVELINLTKDNKVEQKSENRIVKKQYYDIERKIQEKNCLFK